MFAAIRFLWNATRGHRLVPWRSEYLKWRIETYSGIPAGSIGAREFWAFTWREKANLLNFLRWTGDLHRQVKQSAQNDS